MRTREETGNEDIGAEQQEEEHQKARAILPFGSWCNRCLRGRGRRTAQKRTHNERKGVDSRAVTTYSIDCMYLMEKGKEDERDAEEGTASGSPTLVRSIIVGVDWKTGGGTRTPKEMQRQWRPWIATRIAADIEELGYWRSRVVLKADQEVATADVQRQVVAASLGETVPMNSPVGESQSNGRVKNAVQIYPKRTCLYRVKKQNKIKHMQTRGFENIPNSDSKQENNWATTKSITKTFKIVVMAGTLGAEHLAM